VKLASESVVELKRFPQLILEIFEISDGVWATKAREIVKWRLTYR